MTEALIASAVSAGHAVDVVGLAAELAAAEPLREASILLQMRVLGASGRATEALAVARGFRRRLADEAGLDPTPALDDLQRAIAAGQLGRRLDRHGTPPVATARLIGRGADVAALHQLLANERLVTVVGPGGIGKTSLVLEVARRTENAIVLPLAPLTDPSAVADALAVTLALDVAPAETLPACVAYLADHDVVLVVDNCEHLLEVTRELVEALLTHCPRLRILATSRERLGVTAEYTFRLSPLAVPTAGQDVRAAPSVAVFLERADRVRPGFLPTDEDLQAITDIVQRLDGMPLAIELAAGRLASFSTTDLRDRLDRSLDLLAGGRSGHDARHRTLRATIEWSYELLSSDEQRAFRHLSVFVDGVSLEAAETIVRALEPSTDPGSILARLVDASMFQAEFAQDGTRFRMLETLRMFGLDRLAAVDETDRAVARMVRWAVDLVAWLAATFITDREPDGDATLRREFANLRAAWQHVRAQRSLDDAAAIIVGLFDAVAYRDLVEVRGWALELAHDVELPTRPLATEVLGTAAEAAYQNGDLQEAERLAREGLAYANDDSTTWQCHMAMSVVALARADFSATVEHALHSRPARPREAAGLAALATAYHGDLAGARALNEVPEGSASSPSVEAWSAYVDGEIESLAGHLDLAEQRYLEARDLAHTAGATFLVGIATVGLVAGRGRRDDVAGALQGYRDTIHYFASTGNWTHLWATLRNLAELLRRLGDDGPAASIEAAAAEAPDAPAIALASEPRPNPAEPSEAAGPSRSEVLRIARQALDRHLP